MLVQEADCHRHYLGLDIDWCLGAEVSARSGGTVRNIRWLPVLGIYQGSAKCSVWVLVGSCAVIAVCMAVDLRFYLVA